MDELFDVEQEQGTWDEAVELFDKEMAMRKVLIFPYKGKEFRFTIKQLSQKESDAVTGKVTMYQDVRKSRNRNTKAEIPIDTGRVTIETFKRCCTEGPPRFDPTNEEHIRKLPTYIRNEVVKYSEEFSTLDEVTRIKFRETGV